jgi:hypothetical protein
MESAGPAGTLLSRRLRRPPATDVAVLAPAAVITAVPGGGPVRTAIGTVSGGDPDGVLSLSESLVGQVVVVPAIAGLLVRKVAATAAGPAVLSWNVVVEVVLVVGTQVTDPAVDDYRNQGDHGCQNYQHSLGHRTIHRGLMAVG